MTGFLIFLLIVLAAGFAYLTFETKFKQMKVTIPQPSEVSIQLANDWKTEVPQLPKSHPRINQAHWHIRTFERPRRKVK
ncbi:hypothetical protein [Solibacillus isronensis]|uniref:hypothetical protein n=1 Tax=Solibacillus isronensis TaxID=412383 RepID=UPI0039A0ED5F